MSPKKNNDLPEDKDTRIAQLEQALVLEAALEKVRKRTMTMQKSEELADVASLVFQLLKELKVVRIEDRFHFSLHDEKRGISRTWITEPNGHKIVQGFDFQIAQFPPLVKKVYNRWKNTPLYRRKELTENTIYKGKELDDFIAFVATNPMFAKEKGNQDLFQNKPAQIVQNGAFFSHGVLEVTSTRQFAEKELRLLQRFAGVFEQTYTRFLDLQKAEEQTREAQIEAALERVRAASMAMHKTEELESVVTIVFNQLKALKIDFIQTWMTINYMDKGYLEVWWSPVEGVRNEAFFTKLPAAPFEDTTLAEWKKGKPFSFQSIEGQEAIEQLIQEMDKMSGTTYFNETMQKISTNRLEITDANHKFGSINVLMNRKATEVEQNIFFRFSKVFEQTYTRFLDLQKAEAQAREAQIEAALERVRAASMAMYKSEDLSKVVKVLFTQLQELNIEILVAYIGIFNLEEHFVETWYCPVKAVRKEPFLVKTSSIPWEETTIKDWKEGKDLSYISVIGKEATMQFAEYLQTLMNTDVVIKMVKELQLETIESTEANHQYGNLAITQNRKATTEEKAILKRFAKVFEQTYTRFLDLQRAEEQAREAQIEASLERVRAASMAMHKSEELPAVALAFFKQIEQLGIPINATSVNLVDEAKESYQLYFANENDIGMAAELAIKDFWFAQESFRQLKKGKKAFTVTAKGTKLQAVIDFIKKEVSQERGVRLEKAKLKKAYMHTVQFHDLSHIIFTSITPFSEATLNVLSRMTKVFGRSYTRFLDLQKAEAQAREAQIEAALERVRAASMAMHKSAEITAVNKVLNEQLKVLGLRDDVSNVDIYIVQEEEKKFISYSFVNIMGREKRHEIGINELPEFQEWFKFWRPIPFSKRKETTYIVEFQGERVLALADWTKKLWAISNQELPAFNEAVDYMRSTGYFGNYAHFGYGVIVLGATEILSPEKFAVLQRFAATFEQTYTRFLDLQKAEEQAREAQIEAALERVRAASMAMHKTNQLIEVTTTLFEELKVLELEINVAWISLIHRENNSFETWITGFDKQFPEAFNFGGDYNDIPEAKEVINRWLKGEEFIVYDFVGNQALQSHIEGLIALTGIQHFNIYKGLDYMQNFEIFHKYGTLGMSAPTAFTPHQKHVLKRFSIVFEQAYTRFLDIQKAEAQAREAQIEAALERVRAASMAMHKTNQLIEVTTTLFDELKVLELEVIAAWITLIYRENKNFETWVIGFDEQQPEAFNFGGDYNIIPQLKEVTNRWLKGEEFIVYDFVGNQAVQLYLNDLIALTDIHHFNKFSNHDYIQNLESSNKYGTLGMASTTEFPSHQKHVLKRFSIVFEQAYTRFLDIQKAEEQAREAQIEAALEKVRAKTASMYKSIELEAVVSLVFQQLRLLDFDSKQCIIGIIDKATLETEIWQSVDAQSGLPNSYKIPKLDHPFIQQGYDAYLNGEQYQERELSGAAKKSYDKLIFEQTDLKKVPAEVKAAIIQNKKIVTGSAYMSHGVIQVIGAAALSAEKAHILQRFAAAIDLTYTRFLDIQKAEQQKIQLEKIFSENQRLLHSILPEQIAEQIRQGQQTVVKRFEQVSILFADIVGFTVLSDRLSPQEVVDILNGLFSKFDDLTDKYGLEKIKTIGDAYMVAAGVPEEKANHAQLMFAFAKDMLQTLQGYNKIIGTDLKIRIGISSGPVVAGVIGKKKFAYDLWGDTVNTAARMEAYGHADCIQVSPTTYAMLKKEATFEKIPNVEIKGKGKMDVYLWTS